MALMSIFVSRRNASRIALAAAALAMTVLIALSAAQAKNQRTYFFLLHEVKLVGTDLPPELVEQVRGQIVKSLAQHERLTSALPADAPDPKADPKGFEQYIKKNRIQPYRVNVEVTAYSRDSEAIDEPRKGTRLEVSVSLRTFGETMPKRVMAFSGDGSATIKVEVGKRVRDRDWEYANQQAIELAVAEALQMSIERLDAKLSPAKGGKSGKK